MTTFLLTFSILIFCIEEMNTQKVIKHCTGHIWACFGFSVLQQLFG